MIADAAAVARAIGISAAIALGAGCGAGDTNGDSPAASPQRDAIQEITLPDLSQAAGAVRDQVQAAYRSLEAARTDPVTEQGSLAAAYGHLGNVLLAAEYFHAAETCYLNARTLAPGEFRWPYYLGHVYLKRSEWEPAARAFEGALAIRPDDGAALVWLGEVRLAQGQYDAAERAFIHATAAEPHAAAAPAGLGRVAFARRDYTKAVEFLERALTLDPRLSGIRYPLALAYRELGNVTAAEAHLRRRGGVAPRPPDPLIGEIAGLLKSAQVYDERAQAALGRGDWAEAIALAQAGIALAGDNRAIEAALRLRLGTALAQSGDPQAAYEEFERTVQLVPDFARGHYTLGVMLKGAGRWPEAIERLSDAVKYDPRSLEARLALGEVLLARGRAMDAAAQYEAALAVAPQSEAARAGYAEARARMGQ